MKDAAAQALKWLEERGSDAVRQGRANGRQQVLCAGEVAPFMWSTFKQLLDAGRIEQYGNWRLRIKGKSA